MERLLVRTGSESTGLVLGRTSADDKRSRIGNRGRPHTQVHSLRSCPAWERGRAGNDKQGCHLSWGCTLSCRGRQHRRGRGCKDQVWNIGSEDAVLVGLLGVLPCTCTWPAPLGGCTWLLGGTDLGHKGSLVALVAARTLVEVVVRPQDKCLHSRRSSKVPSWGNRGQGLRRTSRSRAGLCTRCVRAG